MRARKLSFSAESVEAAHIFGQSRSRAEYVQNLSAIAFDTAENEFLQVRLLFLFENASRCMIEVSENDKIMRYQPRGAFTDGLI